MIPLLDTSESLDVCEAEIGLPVEQLLTPLTRRALQRPGKRFAIDNGAFARFNSAGFRGLLKRLESERKLCRFVAVPDVVGSARRTLEAFEFWHVELVHWPLAFVCQDGQEHLPIPWDRIKAIFIGGSTEWKCSRFAVECIKTAQTLDKWTHVGRVNTPGRFKFFEDLGVNSIDGTGIARYSRMRELIAGRNDQKELYEA